MMKFKKAWIYGFGKWIDHIIHFENGHSSFICLYGENESGKSTLQQFILYMLFDLPPRKRKFYYPKRGNQFGGQLTIVDSKEGTFNIERISDRLTCLLPNGKEAGEA